MTPTACRYCGVTHDGINPVMDCPHVLHGEIIEAITHGINAQPRNHQKRLGPSELGNPCPRALIHKLAGDTEPTRSTAQPDGFRAWVGTQMHSGFEAIMRQQQGRYLCEQRVNVGDINGIEITGNCDLFDIPAGAIWDWKTKSKTQLEKCRRDINAGRGPGPTHRVQQHCYGRGMTRAGHQVRTVGIIYLPRDGNLSDGFFWSEPFDEQVAVDALTRCTNLARMIEIFGRDLTLTQYPQECEQPYCAWCGPTNDAKRLVDLTEQRRNQPPATTTRELFASAQN